MIIHNYKCIFVHVPKTAGVSIEGVLFKETVPLRWPIEYILRKKQEVLQGGGFIDRYSNKYQTGTYQHLFARHIKQEVGEELFDSYFKFGFVRNPWDRIISQFFYQKRRRDLNEFLNIDREIDFKDFLYAIKDGEMHVHWDEQWKFLMDEEGNQMVDFIGRFENLQEDFDKVCDNINAAKIELPHENFTVHEPYQYYYDDESRELVAEMYDKDIKLFNYKYDGSL